MRLERRPEKTCHKKPLWGKNVQEIWVGSKAQAPSDLKPILRRLYKNEIRTANPTGLDAWYLKKKELNKEKIKQNGTKRTRLVLRPRWQPRVIPLLIYPYISTHDAPAWNPDPCCISCRQNSYFSLAYSLAHSSEISYFVSTPQQITQHRWSK